MELNELLKELDENLTVSRIEKSGRVLYIYCNINCIVAKCKYCGMESHSIHSRYIRTISDLPIQDYQVKLVITVPKFFCANETCCHKTFAYPIPFAAANSLRTRHLDDYIYQVGMKNSSLEAETVTRDFSKAYKAAISEALPDAKQTVDRFHILKNLTEDMMDYLKRKIRDNIKVSDFSTVPTAEKEVLNIRERRKIEKGLKKWGSAREAQKLKESGRNNTEIAKMLQISHPTVIKYLNMSEPPIASRPCKLDPYIPRIKELLLGGYRYTEIFNQIKKEGYTGEISLYNSKMKGIRWEVSQNIRYLKRSDIKKLLYTPIEAIQDDQKRKDIERYLGGQPEVKQMLELVSDFKTLLSGSDENKPDEWIKKAEGIQITELDGFLKLIRSDKEAVQNAIRYQYSNGPTEGHNNKIKVIKRQMYGRC